MTDRVECPDCGSPERTDAATCSYCGHRFAAGLANPFDQSSPSTAEARRPTAPNPYESPTYSHQSAQDRSANVRVASPNNGLAVASLVVGIVSLLGMLLCAPIGLLGGIVGLPLGIFGLKSQSRGMAIAGIVMSSIALVFTIGMIILMVVVVWAAP